MGTHPLKTHAPRVLPASEWPSRARCGAASRRELLVSEDPEEVTCVSCISHLRSDVRVIRVDDIGTTRLLTHEERIAMTELIIRETAAMEALVLVNGRKIGWQKYQMHGGCMGYDGDDLVVAIRPGALV